jgi:hypothetical protein
LRQIIVVTIISVIEKTYSSTEAATVAPSIMHTTRAIALYPITEHAIVVSAISINNRFIDINI